MSTNHRRIPGARRTFPFAHRIRAEKALRKELPLEAVVHHANDKVLIICQNEAYHKLLHRRERALKKSGHANYCLCNRCRGYDSPEHLHYDGRRFWHIKPYDCWNRARKQVPLGTR